MKSWRGLWILSAALTFVATPQLAKASLGQGVDSIESDGRLLRLHARHASSVHKSYKVYELVNASRMMREYVSAKGEVFAITWEGRNHPDLAQLLGDYFSEFRSAEEQVPMHRGNPIRRVASEHVVVVEGGTMGHVYGRVFAPSLAPDNVEPKDLP